VAGGGEGGGKRMINNNDRLVQKRVLPWVNPGARLLLEGLTRIRRAPARLRQPEPRIRLAVRGVP